MRTPALDQRQNLVPRELWEDVVETHQAKNLSNKNQQHSLPLTEFVLLRVDEVLANCT